MPTAQNEELYNAIIEVALERFAVPENLEPYRITRTRGTSLYRYVGYRNTAPQIEAAGRTIWTNLANDTNNRWTGRSPNEDVVEGSQGLYLSGEYLDIEQPFPELDHYMDRQTDPNDPVLYYRYQQGAEPELVLGTVGELRSMFLFTTNEELEGINLSLNEGGEHELLQGIFDTARERYPDAFQEDDTLEALYRSGDDASFCRAIGNAVLEKTDAHFFQTTSVRDGQSSNIIMRSEQGTPVEALIPQGRSSFFLNEGGNVEGVFTILDLQYNAVFEQDGMGVLPAREEIVANLSAIAEQMSDRIIDQYNEALELQAPTQNMQDIGKSLSTVQERIRNGELAEALTEIRNISQRIADIREQGGMPEIEVNSFNLVDTVMQSLDSITDAARIAREAPIEDPEAREREIEEIDFRDPDQEQVDPRFEDI